MKKNIKSQLCRSINSLEFWSKCNEIIVSLIVSRNIYRKAIKLNHIFITFSQIPTGISIFSCSITISYIALTNSMNTRIKYFGIYPLVETKMLTHQEGNHSNPFLIVRITKLKASIKAACSKICGILSSQSKKIKFRAQTMPTELRSWKLS